MGTLQQIGGKINSTREVELNTLAARSVLRSLDSTHGSYSFSSSLQMPVGDGTVALFSTVTNIPWAGLQWTSTVNLMVIKQISAAMATNVGTAGLLSMQVLKASGYVQQFDTVKTDTAAGTTFKSFGQTLVLGHGNKLRNTMLASDLSSPVGADLINITGSSSAGTNTPGGNFTTFNPAVITASAFAGLPGGVFTLETIPICAGVWSAPAAVPRERVGLQTLFDAESYGHPIVLENSTGLVFKVTWPATSTGAAPVYASTITIQWDEVPVY